MTGNESGNTGCPRNLDAAVVPQYITSGYYWLTCVTNTTPNGKNEVHIVLYT